MYSFRREIVLIDQLANVQICHKINAQLNDNEYFVLDPVLLYSEVDWTKFEDDVDMLNSVYATLFDEFVITRKKLICYWPSDNFGGQDIIKLKKYCRDARIGIDLAELKLSLLNEEKMLPEYEGLWRAFIMFIVESLSEDIKINEAIEDIATLKCQKESVWIFSMREGERVSYSYLKSQIALFGFRTESDVPEMICSDDQVLFSTFNELLTALQNEINIKEFSASFSNSTLEKEYYSAICQNFQSHNLVQHWISTYSKN